MVAIDSRKFAGRGFFRGQLFKLRVRVGIQQYILQTTLMGVQVLQSFETATCESLCVIRLRVLINVSRLVVQSIVVSRQSLSIQRWYNGRRTSKSSSHH
jgi:hypothetical protein